MARVMRTLVALLTAASFAPAAAQAQGNDPASGSPSGTIYEIPLDNARGFAAPRDRRAAAATSGQPAAPSSIHSENGFGSSSQVPGAPARSQPAGGSAKAGGATAKAGGGTVGEGAKSMTAPNAEALIRPVARASTPSSTRAYVLLLLAAGIAVALGVAARVAGRRR